MSDDIKKLIERLRSTYFEVRDFSLHDVRDAADALEQNLIDLEEYRRDVAKLTEERDRLRAALVRLRDCDWVITLPDRMDAVREIARKALGASDAGLRD